MDTRKSIDRLTVGKYPSVKTLSKLVFPHAPSPIITSFLLMISTAQIRHDIQGDARASR